MPVPRFIACAAAVTAVGVLLFGSSTRTAAAARTADPVASETVPDLGIGPSTTVGAIKAANPGWTFRVVKEVSGSAGQVVEDQYPEPNSVIEITEGQIMHLMVSGSTGFMNDIPTLQAIVAVELVVIVVVLILCRFRRIRG
jgi:hypothetical protein